MFSSVQQVVKPQKLVFKPNDPTSNKVVSDEQLSTAEITLRIKLLREDSKLQKIHKELVISDKLT